MTKLFLDYKYIKKNKMNIKNKMKRRVNERKDKYRKENIEWRKRKKTNK